MFGFTNKNYDLRNASVLKGKINFRVDYGSESISILAPNIWELVPDSIREEKTLTDFKNKIKVWATDKCLSRLLINYLDWDYLDWVKAVLILFFFFYHSNTTLFNFWSQKSFKK